MEIEENRDGIGGGNQNEGCLNAGVRIGSLVRMGIELRPGFEWELRWRMDTHQIRMAWQ